MLFRIAVFGAGKWAQTVVAMLIQREDVVVSAILAKDTEKRRDWTGAIPVYTSVNKLFEEQKIDGVVICTPPTSHLELCLAALDYGLPCFLEKPAVLSSDEMMRLHAKANAVGVPIVVDYIHLYSTPFQDLVKECSTRSRPKKVIALAGNMHARPRDCSMLWDWGAHDVSMCVSCLGKGDVQVKSAEAWPKDDVSFESVKLKLTWDGVPVSLRFSEGLKRKARIFAVQYENEVLLYNGLSPHTFAHWKQQPAGGYRKVGGEGHPSASENPLGKAFEYFVSLARKQISEPGVLDLSVEVTRILELCDQGLKS